MPTGPTSQTKPETVIDTAPAGADDAQASAAGISAPPVAPTLDGAAGSAAPAAAEGPFWKLPLEAISEAQWESLCDGCGRCCLVKLEDEDTGQIHFTNVTCRLLDAGSCQCSDYPGRKAKVPDCIKLTPQNVREIPWLPPTCAYRLAEEGKDLYPWHHLVSGSRETVHEAGISVRGRTGPGEDDVQLEDMLDYIVKWPGKIPKPKKARG